MASVRRKEGSPYWFGCVNMPGGRRRQFSTRRTNRQEALDFANSVEISARQARDREHFLKLLGDLWGPDESERGTVFEYVTRWLSVRAPEVAPATARFHRMLGADVVARWGARPFDAVSSAEIAAARDEWRAQFAAGTCNNRLGLLRRIWRDAHEDGLSQRNEASKVRSVRAAPSKARRPFSIEEIRVIFEAAGDEWRGMILAGLYTGQRLGDLASLTWAGIDLERRELRLRAAKTGRLMLLPIAEPLLEWLLSRTSGDIPDLPLFRGLVGLETSALSKQFRRLLVESGLVEDTGGRAALSFHSLRHSATSLLKAAGVSEAVAMAIVGHASPAISQAYTSLAPEILREAVARLPRV